MSKPIHFALIGCGNIAAEHIAQINRVGVLSAVVDIQIAKAKQFSEIFQVPFFSSTADLYASAQSIDVVVIATPNGLHAEQAIEAMHAGYHVLVEKPMALTVQAAEAMGAASKATGKQLFLVMQNRFNPPVQIVYDLLQKQALGKIHQVQVHCFWHRPAAYYTNSWHGTLDLDGGTLFTQFSHFIDLLCWLFGPVSTVTAELRNRLHQGLMQFEDEGELQIIFESGIHAQMAYSVNEPIANREGSLTILSEKGTVKAGGAYLNELIIDLDDAVLAAAIQQSYQALQHNAQSANDYGSYQGSMRNHHKVYDALVASVMHQQPYYTTIEEGKNTIALINRIYQARLLKSIF